MSKDIENLTGADATDFAAVIAAIQGFTVVDDFPVSPSLNQRVYHTGHGMMAFYDGTRWLSDGPPLPINFNMRTPPPFDTTESLADFGHPFPGVYDILFERCSISGRATSGTGNIDFAFSLIGISPTANAGLATLNLADNGTNDVDFDTATTSQVWLAAMTDYSGGTVAATENGGTSQFYGSFHIFYRLILT